MVVTACESVSADEAFQGECHRSTVAGVARDGQAVQVQGQRGVRVAALLGDEASSSRVCAMPGA